jgi:hypothetical protein
VVRAALLLLSALVLTAGCRLKEVPVSRTARHDEIAWRADFAKARADARALSKPMLLVMVAGAKDDRC